MGGPVPKQFLDIGGRPLLDYSVEAFLASPRVSSLVIAVPAAALDGVRAALPADARIAVVAGGARRQDSVAAAFAQVDARTDVVLIHDAARPFVSAALIERTIDAAAAEGAAIAAIAARDTIKQAAPAETGAPRVIAATLPRDSIYLAQTPQGFRREVLARAIAAGADGADVTDEAMLAERAGYRVRLVDGETGNIKVTTQDDLEVARLRLAPAEPAITRIGTGYDLHRLAPGRALILAGVTIPFELGLDGHSDADIVCHAVTDAVLGAAAAGDIGRLFPDTDPEWKGADSIVLLRRAMALVRQRGYAVVNVDVTVIAQKPKLLPYLDAMRDNLAAALGCAADAVSVKGKTNERLDSMGRGESMACHVVAGLGPCPPQEDHRQHP